jgi:hypothetical protein
VRKYIVSSSDVFIPIVLSIYFVLINTIFFQAAYAEQTLYDNNDFTVNLRVKIAAAAFTSNNTNFGIGRFDFYNHANTGDASWQEAYVNPGIRFEWDRSDYGTLYGALSFVGAGVGGDGDAGGFTKSGTDVDLEYLNLGWHNDVIDISFGAQDYIIGDGFLVMDGNFDAAEDGAFWVLPRTAFRNSAIARFNTKPIHGEIFYLKADDLQDDTELVGINIETTSETYGTFGTSYLNIIDADPVTSHIPATSRHGMNVVSVRANSAKIPGLSDFSWHAEYVKQFGEADGGRTGDFTGDAWYVEGNYSFSNFIWTPKLTYRYAYFSGDDGTDADQESFDPLFYSYNPARNGGWGSWFQGEVVGNYLLFNSNQENHMLKLDVYPAKGWSTGLIFFTFDLDEKNYFGIPVTDNHFADEINFYIDWLPKDNIYLAIAAGIAFPGDAAEQVFGDDEDYTVFEIYGSYTF